MSIPLETPKQFSKRNKIPISRVRSMISKKEIAHVYIGARALIPSNALDEFIQNNMVEPNLNEEQENGSST